MTNRWLAALPVYNEVGYVNGVLDEVLKYAPDVLAVNDGSNDGTRELLDLRSDITVLHHDKNLGYGAALRTAFQYAVDEGYDVIVTLDCDGQHQPKRIPEFVAACEDVDIVSGSRYLKKYDGDSVPPAQRLQINKQITKTINDLFHWNLTDTFCGFKAYRTEAISKLNITVDGYAMPLELWAQAAMLGMRILEVPVRSSIWTKAAPLAAPSTTAASGWLITIKSSNRAFKPCVTEALVCLAKPLRLVGSALRVSHSVPQNRPSLKVPKENNRFLCWPPASDSQQLLQRNQVILSHRSLPVWFRELRSLARIQALAASKTYMSNYAPALAELISIGDLDAKHWIVGGHQPELFHPGVWFKNFLMSEIGKQTDSIGMQVIVDHDVARSDSLRVPYLQSPNTLPSTNASHRPASELSQRSIPLPIRSESQPRMPWHATLTRYADPESWSRTLANIEKSTTSCGLAEPLLHRHQVLLKSCIASQQNIGDAFSEFRHRLEMTHGVFNLEVPLGHLCSDSAFGFFVQHCVQNAESLWSSYNRCRDAYRARHRIRNQGQPVLELLRTETSFELPFWIYLRNQAVVERKRMWASPLPNNQMLLCDHAQPARATVSAIVPLAEDELAGTWQKITERGICIRPRALMTTMYLRCFVADLFVHGIGGGTYDELTDDIIKDWIGIDAPVYLTSSASLHLPLHANQESQSIEPTVSRSSIERELHLMRSVPERYLDRAIDSQRILAETHAQKIASIPERGKKRAWHKEMANLKQQIEIAIEPKKREALSKLEATQRELQQRKIVSSREYSFVLFEEQDVVDRLSRLASAAYRDVTDSGK